MRHRQTADSASAAAPARVVARLQLAGEAALDYKGEELGTVWRWGDAEGHHLDHYQPRPKVVP